MKKWTASKWRRNFSTCGDMNSACQIHSLYKKMAKDMGKELERRTFYHWTEAIFYVKMAQETWIAVMSTEGKFQELRKENDHNRQMLAKLKSKFQPFPQPTEAWKCQGTPLGLQDPQEGGVSCSKSSRIQGHL